jgi:hypothetical protein
MNTVTERHITLYHDSEDGELSLKNDPPGEINRDKITQRVIGDYVVTGTLKAVHYASFSGTAAALILFRFNFQPPGGSYRFKSAKIEVTFASPHHPRGRKSPDREPLVCNFFPAKVSGEVTEETVHSTRELSMSLTSSVLPVTPGINTRLAIESTLVRKHYMTILGIKKSDSARHDNVVVWKISENAADKSGIPTVFTCGIIVHHRNVEFAAHVDVSFSAVHFGDPRLLLNGRRWTKDDPVLFDCSTAHGSPSVAHLVGDDLSMLTEQQWEAVLR